MPAPRTAQYLCDRTRHHIGTVGDWNALLRDNLRDGFSTDEGAADRAILPGLNEAIGKLLTTGQYKCRFSLQVPAGTPGVVSEFGLDPGIGLVEYVAYQGLPLQKTTLTELMRRMPGWINQPPATRPRFWYNDIPDVIGLVPPPLTADPTGTYSLEILAESLSNDLALPTDIPARLPAQFHDDLAIWAAIVVLRSLGGTDDIMAKIGDLRRDWDGGPDATIGRVQRLAQHRDQNEVSQLRVAFGQRWGGWGWGNNGSGAGWL